MKNAYKLIASQYIVKQAMMAKLLGGLSSLGSKFKNAIPQIYEGAANPVRSGANAINMMIPKSMGGRYDKFDKNVLLQGLGGAGLLGGIGTAGAISGKREGVEEGASAAIDAMTKKIMELAKKQRRAKEDRGYFGRLTDALTNVGYSRSNPGLKHYLGDPNNVYSK
jgi:hypothetical protein